MSDCGRREPKLSSKLSELELAESLSLPSEPRLRSRVVRPLAGGALVTVFRGNRRNSLLLYGLNIKISK